MTVTTTDYMDLDYDSLVAYIGFELNYGRSAWSDSQLTVIRQALDSGYRQFLYPDAMNGRSRHRWSFLWPEATLTLSAALSDGTIGISSGVVTGAGTAFPTTSAQWELTPASGSTYGVASYSSGTSITLDDTSDSADSAAGTEYILGRVEYDLPTNFGGLEGEMTYSPEASTAYDPVQFTSWSTIRRLRQLNGSATQRPMRACLLPKTSSPSSDPSTNAKWKLVFDYQSDDDYALYYRYKVELVRIGGEEGDIDKYPIGGTAHSETLLASCLYAAARLLNEDPSKIELARKHYMQRLAASIAEDEAMAPDHLGYLYDTSEDVLARRYSRHNDIGVLPRYEGAIYY